MVQPLNDDSDIKERLKFLGQNVDQYNLSSHLETAVRKMNSLVGRNIEEQLRPSVEDQNSFQLTFNEVHSIEKVELGRPGLYDQSVNDSDYSVTKYPAEISFNTTWAEDNLHSSRDKTRITYIPTIFKELELMLALEEIMNLASIQTGDDETRAQFKQYKERRKELVKSINRTAQNIDDSDSGDNLPNNYNYPGEF